MIPTRLFSVFRATFALFCFSCLLFTGAAEPVGTLIREFDYEVMDFARDPVRPRIYATTSANTLIVIDTQTVQIISETLIGSNPLGLAISPDASRLYVACSGSTTAGIAVVNLATLEKLPSLPTPFGPADVAAGLGERLYISPLGSSVPGYDQLRQISAVDGAVQATFGNPAFIYYGAQLALTPDRTKLFMGNVGLSPCTLARYDVGTVTPTFEQMNTHGGLGSNGQRLIMSHTGDIVCFAAGSGNAGYDIRLIPVGDVNGSVGSFGCGAYPTNGAFSPDDDFFYTAPDSQRKVRIFNTATFAQAAYFLVPQDTLDMIADARGRHLYTAGTDFSGSVKLRVYATGRDLLNLTISHSPTVSVHRGDALTVSVTSSEQDVTFSATGLPNGVTIDAASGVISGTASVAGNYTVQISASNAAGDEVTSALMLHVLTPFTVTVGVGGAVTTGYAGTTWQEIGALISLTATADAGYQFVYWSGALKSNAPTISLPVAPDLAIAVQFSPFVDFTTSSVGPGALSPVNLRGTTQHPAGEQVSLLAVPTAGARFTGWSGAASGTANPLLVAISGGETITANFEMIPTVTLFVGSSGPGSVVGVTKAQTAHPLGTGVTLSAVPLPGARFIGWVGSTTSVQTPLTISLLEATTLIAQFEDLRQYAGSYRAALAPGKDVVTDGILEAVIGRAGGYSAKLRYAGGVFVFTGNASPLNGSSVTFRRTGSPLPLVVRLRLENQDGVPSLFVEIKDGSLSFATVGRRRAVFTEAEPTALAGNYTFLLPASAQYGFGFGTAKVAPSGLIQIEGVLGDGTPFTQGTYLTVEDHALLYAPLYSGGGYISGTVDFDETASESDFAADLNWSRPVRPNAKRYAAGFVQSVALLGSRFRVPEPGANLFSFGDAHMVFENGGMRVPVTVDVQCGAGNVIAPTPPFSDPIKAKVSPKTGAFSGSFLPNATARRAFTGIVFQKTGTAVGQHIGPTSVGSVLLEAR